MMNKLFNYFMFLIPFVILHSCTKMDDFVKYTDGKEKIYPAIIDSAFVQSGKNRVKINGILDNNHSISKVLIYWNNKQDSSLSSISEYLKDDTVSIIIDGLKEGPISFVLHTIDRDGNKSVPQNLTGNVYGERYKQSLFQRAILDHSFLPDQLMELSLQNVSSSMGFEGIRLNYLNRNKELVDTVYQTKNQDASIILKDYLPSEDIKYQTIFRPDSLSIDTFAVQFDDYFPTGNITAWYLKNYETPFYASEFDGDRWGTLQDWITNDAMKNHNGVGGYASDDGGIINIEAGWGAPAILDGKIEQEVVFYPGKYKFFCDIEWTSYEDPPAYLTISLPNESLPDYDDISSSLQYAMVKSEGVFVEFDKKTKVNIGLVVNFNPDNYLKINSFTIKKM